MSDRRPREFDLEQALRDLGSRVSYPPTVDLLPAVRARIEQSAPRSSFLDLFRSPLQLAPAVATLALLVLATLVFQPIATTAAEALGLRGITIFRGPEVPPLSGRTILADARRMATVEGASTEVGFRVRVPAALGEPDEVYVRIADGTTQAFLVYGARAGIPVSEHSGVSVLVTELRGALESQLLGKGVPAGTLLEEVQVNGARGVWIAGAPHQVFYRAPSGEILTDTVRLAGNVLLWEQDGLLMRIEAQVSKERALEIARSMRVR